MGQNFAMVSSSMDDKAAIGMWQQCGHFTRHGASTPECWSPRGSENIAKFSIADALQSPALSLATLMDNSSAMPTPSTQNSQSHTITLRCAEGVSLGVDFSEYGKHLMVEAVAPQGAVEAWNRQCRMSNRQIKPGDQIIAVNSAEDLETMRREVCQNVLLKLTVLRGQKHCEACQHVWFTDVKKFGGKHTKVTKTESLPLGEFAFMIHPHVASSERGGSSFQASEGKGTMQIKCNSDNVGTRTVQVTMGEETHTVTHNFSTDTICKIPTVFNFKSEVEAKGKVVVVFDFV